MREGQRGDMHSVNISGLHVGLLTLRCNRGFRALIGLEVGKTDSRVGLAKGILLSAPSGILVG